MTDLKPCPFCGGDAELCVHEATRVSWVRCIECKTSGGATSAEQAIKAWNTRTERASGATDVLRDIDQLRRDLSGYHDQLSAHNNLQQHCDNQRKRIAELEGLYAKAKAENDKLRELVDYMTPIAWYGASERERDRMRELGVEL